MIKLNDKISEVERFANNNLTVNNDGNSVTLNLTPGDETDRTKTLSANIKGYYEKGVVPTGEYGDFSLLRMTEDGHLYATNSTNAMNHIDKDGKPQVLRTHLNFMELTTTELGLDVDILTNKVTELTNELNTTKGLLENTRQELTSLKDLVNTMLSGENAAFMTALKKNIINA